MPDHDNAIDREVQVELQCPDTEIEGRLEGRQRVLRSQASRAPVPLNQGK